MIYVARIDDALVQTSTANIFTVSPDPLFLSSSLSVTSFRQTASAKILYFQLGPSIILFIREFLFYHHNIIIIINSTIIFEKRRKREKLTISRENRWVDRIDENQSLPGLYIYIYSAEFTSILWRRDISLGGRPSSWLDFEITAT